MECTWSRRIPHDCVDAARKALDGQMISLESSTRELTDHENRVARLHPSGEYLHDLPSSVVLAQDASEKDPQGFQCGRLAGVLVLRIFSRAQGCREYDV